MSLIACPACGSQNDADRRFCVECGTRLAAGCAVCGTVNPPEARFCGQCGNNLTGPAVASPLALDVPGAMGGVLAGIGSIAERRLGAVRRSRGLHDRIGGP